jgi:sugar phosphate isomerase/epimerase
MPILLHAWSLAKPLLSGRFESGQLPALAAQSGFEGLEWLDRLLPSWEPSAWRELGQAQARAGLGTGALSICLELQAPKPLVAQQVDLAKQLLSQCADLGVKVVRVGIGGRGASLGRLFLALERGRGPQARQQRPLGPLARWAYALWLRAGRPGRADTRALPPRASAGELQSAAWALQPLARLAQDLGLVLALENHFGLTSHAEDMLLLKELVWRAGLEGRAGQGAPLGICLDLGNFHPASDRRAAVELLAPSVVHVHFKTSRPDPRQEASRWDYAGLLRVLAGAGYAGAFSVEYEGPGDGLAGARAAADLLNSLWS